MLLSFGASFVASQPAEHSRIIMQRQLWLLVATQPPPPSVIIAICMSFLREPFSLFQFSWIFFGFVNANGFLNHLSLWFLSGLLYLNFMHYCAYHPFFHFQSISGYFLRIQPSSTYGTNLVASCQFLLLLPNFPMFWKSSPNNFEEFGQLGPGEILRLFL